MTDTTPLGLIVVRLKVPVKNMPVGTELGYKDVPDAIAALGSTAFFEVVRDQQGNPIPPLTPEEIEEAQRAAQRRAKSRRLILGADFDPLWNRVEGIPSAEELEQMRDDVDAVADVPPRVEAVEQTTERLDTLTYDVERFIPAASSRADAWQAAIDAAHAAGGGTVTSSKRGTHAMSKGLTLYDGVYIDLPGSGATHLDFTGATVSAAGCIFGTGSITPLPNLSVAASVDALAITLTSAPSLVPGDRILIYDPADFSFSPAAAHYRNGQYATVRGVSGATVTLTAPLYASYPTTVQLFKLTPIRTGISGARITGIQNKRLIQVDFGSALRFGDLALSGSNYSLIELNKCYGIDIADVRGTDFSPTSAGLNYGITLANCQDVSISRSRLLTARHGFSTGGDGAVGCIPNRDLRISDSTLDGASTAQGSSGCLLHSNTEYVTFTNCTMPNGYGPGGDHVVLDNCTIRQGHHPSLIFAGSMIGADHTFHNCRFIASRDHVTGYAFCWFNFHEVGITRTGGTLRFTNCTFDTGPYRAASGTTKVVGIVNKELPANNHVAMQDCTFRSTVTPDGTFFWGLNTDGPFRTVRVDGIDGNMGIYIDDAGADLVDLNNLAILGARSQAVRIIHPAGAAYPNGQIKIRNSHLEGAHMAGMWITGVAGGTDATVTLENVTSLNHNQTGGTAVTDSSMYVWRFDRLVRRGCVYGDTQAVPTQARADSINTITTFIDEDNEVRGSVTNRYLNAVTTHLYRGRGAGAPTLACADGSTYLRTDGGAGNTLYVREGGAWVAK